MIPITQGQPNKFDRNAILWHKPDFTYDAMFDNIWRKDDHSNSDTAVSTSTSTPFDMNVYIKQEIEAGLQYIKYCSVLPMTGFNLTLFYNTTTAYNIQHVMSKVSKLIF